MIKSQITIFRSNFARAHLLNGLAACIVRLALDCLPHIPYIRMRCTHYPALYRAKLAQCLRPSEACRHVGTVVNVRVEAKFCVVWSSLHVVLSRRSNDVDWRLEAELMLAVPSRGLLCMVLPRSSTDGFPFRLKKANDTVLCRRFLLYRRLENTTEKYCVTS